MLFQFCNHLAGEERAVLLLCSACRVAVIILCLFLPVPWVGLLYVSVAFPRYTHLLWDTGN